MNLDRNGSPETNHILKLEDYEDSFGDSEQNLSVFRINQDAHLTAKEPTG